MLAALLTLATAGCAGQGLLYTRVVSPYSLEFHNTPVGGKKCRVNEHVLREPFSGAGVSVSLTSRVMKEAACTAGMTSLYFADLETFSLLNGLYRKKTLILYGD
jgi:hypothetical protein